MRAGDYAWLAIIGYEVVAPRGQLLSEAMDRYRAAQPIVITCAVVYVGLHLLRRIPSRFDPLTRLAGLRH